MIAKILVSGTLASGITIELILPGPWCSQFAHDAGLDVCGEALHPNWGHAKGENRTNIQRVWTQTELDNALADIHTELSVARAALAPVQQGDIEVEL